MAKLTKATQRAIVQRLACFEAPSDIQAALKAEGVDVSLSQIAYYNPATASPDLAAEWRTLYQETRERFVADTAGVAIAHRRVRLEARARLAGKAEKQGNLVLVKDLLEQAAKEVGDVFTNRRGLAVAQGASLDDLLNAAEAQGDGGSNGGSGDGHGG